MGNLPKCEVTKKVWFETRSLALGSIHKNKDIYSRKTEQRVNRLRRKRREERAYKCEYCDGWHLTSQSYKERKQRNQKKDLEKSNE